GVTLRLTNFAGEPILDSTGRPRTATTDHRGLYEFRGLPPGSYSVFEVQPSRFVDGLDTAGSTGGVAVNPGANINPLFLSVLTVDPNNDAILGIPLSAGVQSTDNDFSEILVDPLDPPVSDPPRPPQAPPPFIPITAPWIPRLAFPPPVITPPEWLLERSGVRGYTWHLSVIDGGQPRDMRGGSRALFHNTGVQLDVAAWSNTKVDGSEWTLADREGRVLSRHRFGRRHAVAVTGDWNGDGITELGVFIDGQWFIDLNGNGVWDAGDLWAKLGHDGDLPATGDWDGDGKIDIAVFGPAWPGDSRAVAAEPGLPDVANERTDAMKNVPPSGEDATFGYRQLKRTSTGSLRTDVIDHVFQFGTAGDRPVTGDWNGDGVKTIGIYRGGTWHLDVDGDGRWSAGDVVADFGDSQAVPVVGDWDGNGIDQLGIYQDGRWTLDTNNDRRIDAADRVFTLGGPHHQPVVGDWDGDGADEVGVYRDGGVGAEDS
ncbi:MAG: fibrinogen-binding protein, partial [Planctomycetes bacterium]|nr:fibrinogen-binding protein [Planctomycetota bacterium]